MYVLEFLGDYFVETRCNEDDVDYDVLGDLSEAYKFETYEEAFSKRNLTVKHLDYTILITMTM